MISADDIIAVLKDGYAGGTLAAVEGAGAMPNALDQVQVSRTAFVMPPGEKAIENDAGTGVIRQKVNVDFLILVVFTGISAAADDQSGEMDAAREGIKDALLGKLLGDMKDPITLISCGVLEVDATAGTLIYSLLFSTGYHIRRNA